MAMPRYVWKIEPVASMPDDELVDAIASNLQRYIDGNLSGPDVDTPVATGRPD